MSLLNWGGGLSAMGSAVAGLAGNAAMAQQKSDLEKQQAVLADQLAATRETKLEQLRQTGAKDLIPLQGASAIATAQATAEAQGGQARQTDKFANELPMTAAQTATIGVQQQEADARTRESTKPVAGGYTGSWMVPDKDSPQGWKMVNSAVTTSDKPLDPKSNNLTAQTGLSENALAVARGELSGRFAAPYRNELQAWGEKNGVNIDTLIPQIKASNDILKVNLERNNQGVISEHEIAGTLETLRPLADAVGQGEFKKIGEANVWVGGQTNDPTSIKVADQINRLRNEVANYNAIAGGNLSDSGKPKPTPEDFHQAEALITTGLNSGGLKALGESIASSAEKNQAVLARSLDDANTTHFKLFGATYHPHTAETPTAPSVANPAAPAAPPPPKLPSGVPSGSRPNADASKWLGSDGTIYDAAGKKIGQQ